MDSEAEKVFVRKSVYVPRLLTDMLKKSGYVDSVAEKVFIRFSASPYLDYFIVR
jgi:hypothetical protein